MRNILFLFLKKMKSNRVQSIRSKFMVSDNNLHHIYLDSSFDVNIFGHCHAKSFDLQSLIFNLWDWVLESSKFGEIVHLKSHCSFDYVWNIEVLSVVTSNEIWVNLLHKISPGS
jgi:hypothetical protein